MATILNEAQQSRGVPPRGRSAAMQGFDLAIDDKTATDIYNRIDATEGLERDVLATQLENWASRKMAESQTTAAQEHERIYTDLDGWWADRGGDEVPQDVKFGAANRKFIADQFNQSASEQGDLYPSYRDQYFLKTYGKAPASEAEAYKTISESIAATQKVNQSYDLITGDIALALFDQVNKGTPVDIPALFTKWKEENAEILDALPDDWEANALKAAGEYYAENEQMLREHGDVLQRLYARIVETTGRKVEGAPEDNVKTVEDLNAIIDELGQLSQEVRQRGYTAILMAARRQGMEDKGFWEMAAEAWPRTLNIVRTTGLVAQETDAEAKVNLLRGDNPLFINKATGQVTPPSGTAFSPQDFEPLTGDRRAELLQQAETELQRFNVIRELRDLADNRFDPAKSTAKNGVLKFVQDIAILGPQSLAYTAMAAVPVAGPFLTGAAIYADEYNQLRLEGFSSAQSRTLSLVSAPLQTAAEVFGAKLLFGRYKWYRETIQKLINPARFARSSQAAVSFFGKVVGENITEGFQDLATPLVKDVASALSEEYPDVNWEQTFEQWKDSRLEVLAATLMPVIGGSLVETFNNNERFASARRRMQLLYKPMGITDEEVRYIEDGTTPQERNQRYTETLKGMSAERVKAVKDNIAAQSRTATATQEDATQPTLETQKDANGRLTYIVRDETGKEVYRSTKQAAAEEAFVLTTARSTATRFNEERVQLQGLVEWWNTADPKRADNEQRVVRDTAQGTAQQKLEALQQANNKHGIEELHRRIAQSPYAGTPYDQIQILGEASVEQVGEMVFRSVIALNKNSRVRDAREEMHHTAVRMAVANGRVNEQTMREWLDATERVFAEKGLGITLPRADMTDIVESMAVVQEAFENERISADVEMSLPRAFVDYIKRMIQVLVEVLKRGKAIREALDAGVLPAEFEAFLVETTGVADQTAVDRARERTEQEVVAAPATANYSIGALGDDNPFMHPRGADGKYKGAPKWINAPKTRRGKDEAYMRLRERLYQLVQEGATGRFWYEDSGRAVLRMFNNNVVEAEKFIELLAIYSPQATVEVNTYFALRAYIQRAVNAAKEDFAVKTGAQDDKAKSVLYDNQPWAGRKTDNFYKNIMYVLLKELPASEVAKLKLDAEVYEMLQKPVTVDMWVYRAFGFDSDALTDVAGTGAFGFAERELNLIAEELNSALPEGEAPYLPHQIQAMLWTAIKGRAETKEVKDLTEAQSMKAKDMVKVKNAQGKLVREFKDKEAQKRHMQRWITNALALPAEKLDVSMAAGAFDRFINSVSMRALWETVPSTNTPEGAAIANLTSAQKAAFTRASREIILDENGNDMLAAMLGVPINVSQLLSGGYGTGATPNVVTELFPNKPSGTYDDDVVRAYARAIQYIFRQDAVPWMRYIKYGAENEKSYYAESPKGAKRRFATQAEAEAYAAGKEGYVVKGDAENFALMLDFGEQLTPDFLDQLQQGLVKVHESLGFTQVSPTEVVVTNFRDAETGLPALTDEAFYERLIGAYGEQADISELYTVGEYGPVHDWSADPEGGPLLQASPRFTPDLLEWLRGRRAVSDALQKDWAEGRGVVSNYSISTQSEIDRVSAAMGALDRSPLDTLQITEKIRQRFASIMAENMVELAAMRQGGVAEREVLDEEGNPIGPQPTGATTKATGAEIRRTKLLQALGELDGLLSALPPQVAAKVGGYTVLTNIGTGDRALSNFFIKRLEMIDKELERYLKDRYTKALDQLFERAKPRQDAAGKVPQGKLGASVHALFDELKLATKKTAVEVDGEVTSLEQQVASGELEPDMEAMKGLLADVLPLFANWATADASRMAQAVQIGFDILRKAYKRQRELTQIKRNQQEERRLVARESTGITGDIDEAINKQQNIAGKRWQQWKALNVNLFGFDQLISFVFGRDSKITKEIVNAQRKADNVKADELIGVWEEWQGVLAELAGIEDSRSMKATHKGQDIVYRLAEPKTAKIKHTNMQGEQIELEFSQNQLITITMMWMQPKGRAHMMGKLDSDGNPIGDWHYDQDFVNRVEAKMTPEARAIRRFLLRKYAEEWSSINEVFVRLRGINMPQEDFYSPLGVDPVVAIDSGLLADPSTGFALSAPNRTPPALRSRGAAVAKPKFQDAVQVYFAHRKQMAHWKAYAEFNSDMLSVLGHRNTRNAVEAKGGVEALKTLNKWLTYMTQGGNIDAAAGLAMNEYFNGVMGRIASFILFGKVVTVAIQSTQLGAAAAKMPFPSYIKRLAKLLTGQMSWADSYRSPYIQRRVKEMPPQVQLAMEGLLANKPSYVAEAARRIGWYISGSDGLYTAGTYAMIYDYRLEQAKKAGLSGPEAERIAREEAERDTDEVAQPTRMGARSAFEATMTSPLARSAWAFGSDARKNWAMNAFLWFSNASADRKRQALYFTLIISNAMATILRTIARDIRDDDDEEWFDEKNWDLRRMALMMATDFVYGFPVLGEVAEETAFRLFGEYRPQGSLLSVGDAPVALSRMPQHIVDTLNGEGDPDRIVKDVNRILQGMGLFAPQAASAAVLSNATKDLYEFTKPLWKDDE